MHILTQQWVSGRFFHTRIQSIPGGAFASSVRVSPTFARCYGPSEWGLNRCASRPMPPNLLPPQALPAPFPASAALGLAVSLVLSLSWCLPMSDATSPWACKSASLSLPDSVALSPSVTLALALACPSLSLIAVSGSRCFSGWVSLFQSPASRGASVWLPKTFVLRHEGRGNSRAEWRVEAGRSPGWETGCPRRSVSPQSHQARDTQKSVKGLPPPLDCFKGRDLSVFGRVANLSVLSHLPFPPFLPHEKQ